jgi:hypothetical protein
MDSEEIPQAGDLFNVDGLVAVVTGAGGGELALFKDRI